MYNISDQQYDDIARTAKVCQNYRNDPDLARRWRYTFPIERGEFYATGRQQGNFLDGPGQMENQVLHVRTEDLRNRI